VLLDQAVADLGAGRGDKYLSLAKDRLESRLRGLIEPKEESKRSGSMSVEVTKSEFKKGGGKHLDFFAKGKEAASRAVGVEFYDEEMFESLASEKEMTFARIFLVRQQQIQVLEQIYGLEKDKEGKPTAETQENAKAIEKMGKGGMKLESDDDWRRFLLEKYKERAATTTPAEAFTAVIKLLESFLRAFTTHTPYNIEDFGDNHLTRQFPRALTGQLIQDCGVYALRIAYMLSLLRDHLNLRFRFIALPAHVGLIITGENLPLYIAHNDSVVIYSPQDMAILSKQWADLDEQGEARTTPGKQDEAQMVAELAGLEFIPGVDLPFKLLEVPKTAGGPAAVKGGLWSFYTGTLGATKLFGPETENPKSALFQLHLRYLKVLDSIKAHHNEFLRPFWNEVAHKAWLKHKPVLEKAFADITTAAAKGDDEKKAAEAAYDAAVQLYLDDVEKAFETVESKNSVVIAEQVELFRILKDHPEALAKGAGRTHSARMDALIRTPWWSRAFYEHVSELRNRRSVQAPFAKKEDLLTPMD